MRSMASVGDHLRELRQRRGLSLDEISRATRVASRYLEALESDRFAALPAPVFTRGFILAYCQALKEPSDEALALYDAREGTPVPASRPAAIPLVRPPGAEAESRSRGAGEPRSRSAVLVSFVLLVILGMSLFAVALMTQPAREDRGIPTVAEAPVETAAPPAVTASTPPASSKASPAPSAAPSATPPRAAVGAASPPATASGSAPSPAGAVVATGPTPSSAAPAAATAEPARPSGPPPWLPEVQAATGGVASPYRLVARVSEPTWIRVRTEDGRSSEETVPAGQTREWISNRPFVLTLGNAGGVTLELNGRTLPPLGASGAVISRIVLPPQ
jgi:cytoskeleton protein RodZ